MKQIDNPIVATQLQPEINPVKGWEDLQPTQENSSPLLLTSGKILGAIDQAMLGTTNQPKLEKIPKIDNHYLNQFYPDDFINLIKVVLQIKQNSNPHERYLEIVSSLEAKLKLAHKQMEAGNFRMDKFVTRVLRSLRRQNNINIIEDLREMLTDVEDTSNILVQNFLGLYASEAPEAPEFSEANIQDLNTIADQQESTSASPDSQPETGPYRLNHQVLKLILLLMIAGTLLVACGGASSNSAEPQRIVEASQMEAYTVDELLLLPRVEYSLKNGDNLALMAQYLVEHSGGRKLDYFTAMSILTRLNPTTNSGYSQIPSFYDSENDRIAPEGMIVRLPGLPGLDPADIPALLTEERVLTQAAELVINPGELQVHTVNPGETLSGIAVANGFASYQEFISIARFLPPGSQGNADAFGNWKNYEELTRPASEIIPESMSVGTQLFWPTNYQIQSPATP